MLLASVATELISPARADQGSEQRISLTPSADQLLSCNRGVQQLLDRLGSTAGDLLRVPAASGRTEVGSRWQGFTATWQRDWYELDTRCRFSELKDGKLGVAFDRMAQVHEDLDAMRLKYQGMLIRFEEEQAPELGAMRQALNKSHRALQKRVPAAR